MSSFIKKSRSKTSKILGTVLFLLLMFVNLQITINPKKNGDINLFGIKLSLFMSSAYAYGGGYSCSVGTVCSDGHTISCTGNIYCQRSAWSVTCDDYTTFCNSY